MKECYYRIIDGEKVWYWNDNIIIGIDNENL